MPPLRPRDGDRQCQRKALRRVLVDRADLDTFIEIRKSGDGSRTGARPRMACSVQKEMIVQRVFFHHGTTKAGEALDLAGYDGPTSSPAST
jgi:hypothetical protein